MNMERQRHDLRFLLFLCVFFGEVVLAAPTFAASGPYGAQVAADGPLLHFTFSQPPGGSPPATVTNMGSLGGIAVVSPSGVFVGAPVLVPPDTAALFGTGGVNTGRISVPYHPSLDVSQLTLETVVAWHGPHPVSPLESQQRILERSTGGSGTQALYNLMVYADTGVLRSEVRIAQKECAVTSTIPLVLGATTHVAVTLDGAFLRLYVQGVLNQSVECVGTVLPGTLQGMGIGNQIERIRPFFGTIDELALYNTALSPEKIQSHVGALRSDCAASDSCMSCICKTLPACCLSGFDAQCAGIQSSTCHSSCDCLPPDCDGPVADVSGDGVVTVLDVQCAIVTTLWTLGGSLGAVPPCIVGSTAGLDSTCDQAINIADVLLAIGMALSSPISPSLDADQNNCPDACQTQPESIPLIVTTVTLPDATVNEPYMSQLTTSEGNLGTTWTVSSGVVPSGMSVTESGAVTGTPTAPGEYSFVVVAASETASSAATPIFIQVNDCVSPNGEPCQTCVVSTECAAGQVCSPGHQCMPCEQTSHCGGLPHCGYVCLVLPLPLGNLEALGGGISTPNVAIYGDRDVYWSDDPEGHFLVSFVGIGGFAGDPYPDTTALAAKIRLSVLSGTTVHQTMDIAPSHKLEWVVDVFALEPGNHSVKAELVTADETVLATASRTFIKQNKTDDVLPFPAEGVEIQVHPPKSVTPGPPTLSWPISTGVPFSKFAVSSLDTLVLYETQPNGTLVEVTAQLTHRSGWYRQRGGVRWAGLDFIAVADAIGGTYVPRTYTLKVGLTNPTPSPLELRGVTEAGSPCELSALPSVCPIIEIDTGPARFHIHRKMFSGVQSAWLDSNTNGIFEDADRVVSESVGPYWVDEKDVRYEARHDATVRVTVDEVGPIKAVVIAEGKYKTAVGQSSEVIFVVSITAYAGQPTVRIEHRSIPQLFEYQRTASDIGLDVGIYGAQSVHFATDNVIQSFPYPQSGSRYLHQETAHQFRLEPGGTKGTHSDGWFGATTTAGLGAALMFRDIWQRFPAELEASTDSGVATLTAHRWPEHATTPFGETAEGQSVDESLKREHIHKLRFAHQGNLLRAQWDKAFERALACHNGTLNQTFGDPSSPYCPACPPPDSCAVGDIACFECQEPTECKWCLELRGSDDFYDNADAGSLSEEYYLWFDYYKPKTAFNLLKGNIIHAELALTLFPAADLNAVVQRGVLFQEGPHALPDPHYAVATRVEGWLSARNPETFSWEEDVLERAFVDYRRIALDDGDVYGYLTWGQVFGDYLGPKKLPSLHRISQASHYRNVYTTWLLYFRGNQPDVLDFARINSDLFMSANIYNIGPVSWQPTNSAYIYDYGLGSYHCKGFGPWNGGTWAAHWTDMTTPRFRWMLLGDTFARDVFLKWGSLHRYNSSFYALKPQNNIRDTVTPFGEQIDYYMVTHDPHALEMLAVSRKTILDDPNWQDWTKSELSHPIWHSEWVQRYFELTRDSVAIDRLMGLFTKELGVNGLGVAAYLYSITSDPELLQQVLPWVRHPGVTTRFDAPSDPMDGYGVLFGNPIRYYVQVLPFFLRALSHASVNHPEYPWSTEPNDGDNIPQSFPAIRHSFSWSHAPEIGQGVFRPEVPPEANAGPQDVELVAFEASDDELKLDLHNITGLGDDGVAHMTWVDTDSTLLTEAFVIGPFALKQSRTRPTDGSTGIQSLTSNGAQRLASPLMSIPHVQRIYRDDPKSIAKERYEMAGRQRWWIGSPTTNQPITMKFEADMGKDGKFPAYGLPTSIQIESGAVPGKMLVDWSLFHGTGNPQHESIVVTLDPADGPWLFSSQGAHGPYLTVLSIEETTQLGLPNNPEVLHFAREQSMLEPVLTQLLAADCANSVVPTTCADFAPVDPQGPPTCGFLADSCGRVIRCFDPSLCTNKLGQCNQLGTERCVDNRCVSAPLCTQLLPNDAITVDGSGPNNVWFAGGDRVVRFDGTTCIPVSAPFQKMIALDVVGPNDVWASGMNAGNGIVGHFDGTSWTTQATFGANVTIVDIVAVPGGPVYLVSNSTNTGVHVLENGNLSKVPLLATSFAPESVYPAGTGDLWIGGREYASPPTTGAIHRVLQGVDLSISTGGDYLHALAISAASPNDIWFGGRRKAGDESQLFHWNGSALTPDTGAPSFTVTSVQAFADGLVWAVGPEGVHRRQTDGTWVKDELELSRPFDLVDVWGSAPDNVWAVGGQRLGNCFNSFPLRGVVFHWNGAEWQLR